MSSTSDTVRALVPLGIALAKVAVDAFDGKRSGGDVARDTLAALLDAVPAEELQGYLTDAAARRAEWIGDFAQAAKFGPAAADTGVRKRPEDEPIVYDLQDLDEDEPA